MKRFLTLLILASALCSDAATLPNLFTTNAFPNGPILTNLTTYGRTNFFDNSAGSNGPITLGVQHGDLNLLVKDIVIGPNAKYFENYSITPGDAGYGQFHVNTTHSGTPPSGQNTELQWTSSGQMAFGPGFGSLTSGHIQLGIGAGQGYGSANYWIYLQECGPLSQTSPTGFSGGLVLRTSELQGANQVDHYPGFLAYSSSTNAPGRWGLAATTEFGNSGTQTWDPNTTKPKQAWVAWDGDIRNLQVNIGAASPTNLMPVAFAPDFNVPVCIASTNNVVVFQPCTNVDSTKTLAQGYITVWVTNTAPATPRAIVAPVNCRTNILGVNSGGLAFVTNLTECRFYQYGQKFTNMSVTAWY